MQDQCNPFIGMKPGRKSAPPVPPPRDIAACRIQTALRAHSPEQRRKCGAAFTPMTAKSEPSTGGTPEQKAAAAASSRRMVIGVRVRPLAAKEEKKGSVSSIEVKDGNKVFAYDPDVRRKSSNTQPAEA